ncbi:MAG: hypothetical protein JO013_05470 [Alphaproteobacteria bacterium]|nr:hypothetical protein [Alphaproteobacteria bacterium]
MGKKKDKRAKGDKGAKEIAGVKVPKGLRKAGKAARKLAEQPVVSEAVAAALLAAAAALRDPPATKKGAKAAGDAAGEAAAGAGKQASVLGDALKSIAIDVARRTVEAWSESAKPPKKGGGGGR